MKSFCQIYSFKNLLDKPTYYKNSTNPSCVILILANSPRNFQSSCTFKTSKPGSPTWRNDPNRTKIIFAKQKPRILNYRNYKFFNNTLLRDQVLNKLINSNLQTSDKSLKHFKETCQSVVNTIALLKSRFIRANQAPFIKKEI